MKKNISFLFVFFREGAFLQYRPICCLISAFETFSNLLFTTSKNQIKHNRGLVKYIEN